MKTPNLVKATFTLTEDFTVSIAELIEEGEITTIEEMIEYIMDCMAEDVAMLCLNEDSVKSRTSISYC